MTDSDVGTIIFGHQGESSDKGKMLLSFLQSSYGLSPKDTTKRTDNSKPATRVALIDNTFAKLAKAQLTIMRESNIQFLPLLYTQAENQIGKKMFLDQWLRTVNEASIKNKEVVENVSRWIEEDGSQLNLLRA